MKILGKARIQWMQVVPSWLEAWLEISVKVKMLLNCIQIKTFGKPVAFTVLTSESGNPIRFGYLVLLFPRASPIIAKLPQRDPK